MQNSPYKLVIFDWDGTLMDSAGDIVDAIQQAIGAMKLPSRDDRSVRRMIGLGLEDAFTRLFPEIERGALLQVADEYRRRFGARPQVYGQVFPGVEATLDELAGAHRQLAVATGKSRRGLDKALDSTGWSARFVATRCADETEPKPSPKMLHELLDELQLLPQQALMIGDTTYDMEMARQAGMDAVAVGWGVHEVDELAEAGALSVLDSLDKLPAWMRARC